MSREESTLLSVPQMILIGSAGRNQGKTTLACEVIAHFQKEVPIFALKVIGIDKLGTHCQRGEKGCGLCSLSLGEYELIPDKGEHPKKDTTLMQQAGAKGAYLLKTLKKSAAKAVNDFLKQVPPDTLIVCESNTLREYVLPGVFLFAKRKESKEMKESAQRVYPFADRVVDPVEENGIFALKVEKTKMGLHAFLSTAK